MKRLIIVMKAVLLAVFLAAAVPQATAQNRIDREVDELSTLGSCHLTSVVKRDPVTRKVVKVVKVLQPSYGTLPHLMKAFKEEAASGDYSEDYKNGRATLLLTVKGRHANRIYMLEADYNHVARQYMNGKVTIIVSYKVTS